MTEPNGPLPIVPYLKLTEGGEPRLVGQACGVCGQVFLEPRRHCAACCARDSMQPRALGTRGVLHAYTIIQRSFPHVAVPYVSAVVDMESGATVKGNLVGVLPVPGSVRPGMNVRVVFALAPRKDAQGQSYMAYHFVPDLEGEGARHV
jgi:uncharacterized protein